MTNKELLQLAKDASKNSHSPYSNFRVGCVVLTTDGKTFKGTNIENAAYGSTMCAERVAMFTAATEGYKKEAIKSLALYVDSDTLGSPCGSCRQVMTELCTASTQIIMGCNTDEIVVKTVEELVPLAFDGGNL